MDEAEIVHCLDRQHALCHVEARDVLRERIVLDEHGHQVSSRQELHDEVEI